MSHSIGQLTNNKTLQIFRVYFYGVIESKINFRTYSLMIFTIKIINKSVKENVTTCLFREEKFQWFHHRKNEMIYLKKKTFFNTREILYTLFVWILLFFYASDSLLVLTLYMFFKVHKKIFFFNWANCNQFYF